MRDPYKIQRVFIDQGLDTLDYFFVKQQARVAHRLQESDLRLAEGREDGMERYHVRTETDITRRQ